MCSRDSRSQLGTGQVELEVEMETGTGKTFVYTKTVFELNKRYGWSKFIIILSEVRPAKDEPEASIVRP